MPLWRTTHGQAHFRHNLNKAMDYRDAFAQGCAMVGTRVLHLGPSLGVRSELSGKQARKAQDRLGLFQSAPFAASVTVNAAFAI